MKAVTGILILTNLVLAGVVVIGLTSRTEGPAATIASASETNRIGGSVIFSPSAISARQSEPFRWSLLESTDYPTYIANLRGIGCPEQTIRDIVTADVDENFYSARREELRRKAPAPIIEQALLDLKRGEDIFIASLLGIQPPPDDNAATNAVASAQRRPRGAAEVPVAMPLAFQNIDPKVAGIDTNIVSVVDSVRERFMKEIGSQADPSDPAYRERWKKAQAEADSQLRGMLGLRAYQAYEYRARTAAQTSPNL